MDKSNNIRVSNIKQSAGRDAITHINVVSASNENNSSNSDIIVAKNDIYDFLVDKTKKCLPIHRVENVIKYEFKTKSEIELHLEDFINLYIDDDNVMNMWKLIEDRKPDFQEVISKYVAKNLITLLKSGKIDEIILVKFKLLFEGIININFKDLFTALIEWTFKDSTDRREILCYFIKEAINLLNVSEIIEYNILNETDDCKSCAKILKTANQRIIEYFNTKTTLTEENDIEKYKNEISALQITLDEKNDIIEKYKNENLILQITSDEQNQELKKLKEKSAHSSNHVNSIPSNEMDLLVQSSTLLGYALKLADSKDIKKS